MASKGTLSNSERATAIPAQIDDTADESGQLAQLAKEALVCRGDVESALKVARKLGRTALPPGTGATASLFNILATIAAADVTVARVVEPHLDALAILSQARERRLTGLAVSTASTWGVFASEAPNVTLKAVKAGDQWQLSGGKAWCSLAGSLSHALVTAHTDASTRRLFAVALRTPQVVVHDDAWHASGLTAIPSGTVEFDHADAVPIGEDGWYLERPGFAWGGIGVAACWWGGAVGIARRAFDAAREREPDQIALMHLGALDIALHSASTALASAAAIVDTPGITRDAATVLAHRTRGLVARAAEDVIARVGHALGPGPLALESDHSRRVADLQMYLRQHHAERDDVSLGRKLLQLRSAPW